MYEDFKWLAVGKNGDDAVMVDSSEFDDLEQHKWHRDKACGPEGSIYSYQRGSKKTLGQHLLRSRARGKVVLHKNGDRQDFRKANLEAVERGLHWVYGMEGDPHENLSEFNRRNSEARKLSGAAGRATLSTRRKAASSGKFAGVRPLPNDSGIPRYGVRMMVNKKQKSFGSYATAEEAGRVYDWLLFQLGLERVNFPKETPRAPAKAEQYRNLLGLPPITETDILASG